MLQARRWGLAALLAAAACAEATAQPIRLIPSDGGESPAQTAPQNEAAPQLPSVPQGNVPPVGVTPAVPPANTSTPPGDTAAAMPNGFVIQPLTAPDPSSAGLLDDGNGGLGADMWQGSTRRQAAQALSVLPAPVPSPALRELQRRLLLTIAEVPSGEPQTPSLLGRRIAQLYELGDVDAAGQLAVPKPPLLKDTVFLQVPVDAALLQQDLMRACELIQQGLREDGAPYWQKAIVLCRYHAKDIAGGDLALTLWRDGGGDDAAFSALAAALRGDTKVKLDGLGDAVSPLHLATLRAAGRPVPKNWLEIAAPAVLAELAGYEKADADTRLAAAEAASRLGALPPARLAEAYGNVEITDAQRSALLAGKDQTPRAAAALYQAAKNATEPKQRTDLLQRAFELGQARDLLFPTAAVLQPLAADLTPDESTAAAAPAMIRLNLAAGEVGLARLWYNTLLTLTPKRGGMVAQAWPLLLIAGAETEWQDSRFDAWLATMEKMPAAERNARVTLLLTLAEGAGIAVPAERWDALLAPTAGTGTRSGAPPAIWRNLARAAQAQAKAETVALALALLGSHGTEMADAQTLVTALNALRGAGLGREAQQIALEAALLRNF